MQKIYINKLFPKKHNLNINQLKINHELLTYITLPEQAEQINRIIINHYNKYNLDVSNITITDATACVGGNTIAFAHTFSFVNSIELCKETFAFLENNIGVYDISNINLVNGNSIELIPLIKCQDIIFIDPPWGGRNYRKNTDMRIILQDNISLEQVCLNFLNPEIMACCPKFIIVKLPCNYDIYYFYLILIKYKVYYYNLHKMVILVLENL
jgi:16S rRNA G966 N2-methylase RsmD